MYLLHTRACPGPFIHFQLLFFFLYFWHHTCTAPLYRTAQSLMYTASNEHRNLSAHRSYHRNPVNRGHLHMVQATQTVDAHADETRRRDLEVRRTFAKRQMAIREITMHSKERKRTGNNPQTQISTCLPEHAYYRRRWIDGHEGEARKESKPDHNSSEFVSPEPGNEGKHC